MADFLKLNSFPIPVQNDQWVTEPAYSGNNAAVDRKHDGSATTHRSYQRGVWSARTTILKPDEYRAIIGLMMGDFDLWSYEGVNGLYSSRGYTRTNGTVGTTNPKFGTNRIFISSGTVMTLNSNILNQNRWAFITHVRGASGEYTSWHNVGYRYATGDTYENGVIDATEDATLWMNRNNEDIQVWGKDDTGTNSNTYVDHSVVLWFDPTAAMMAVWSAEHFEWPAPAPYLEMTGDGLRHRNKSSYIVRAVVKKVKHVQAEIDGVWYDNAARIEFEIHEARL